MPIEGAHTLPHIINYLKQEEMYLHLQQEGDPSLYYPSSRKVDCLLVQQQVQPMEMPQLSQ